MRRKAYRLLTDKFEEPNIFSKPKWEATMLNRRQFLSIAAASTVIYARTPGGFAAQAAGYDLIIKGGRVIDPSVRLDAIRDVAISAGRIAAVADVFDALTSDRPYRPAYERSEALRMLREGSGTQFDPQVLKALFEPARVPRRLLVWVSGWCLVLG